MTKKKLLCIYHANCADGIGAAWAVHRVLGDNVEFVAAKYGEQHDLLTPAECVASGRCPSQDDIPRSCPICDGGLGYCKKCHRAEVQLDQPCGIPSVEDRDVLIVDFSYPLEVLRAMAAEARSVLVIDHHKTAAQDLSEIAWGEKNKPWPSYTDFVAMCEKDVAYNLAAIFDMNRSGAGLTWDYLHGGNNERNNGLEAMASGKSQPRESQLTSARSQQERCAVGTPTDPRKIRGTTRPRIIDLIEDRDLWRFKYGDESRAFHAVMASYDWNDLPGMFKRMDQMSFGGNGVDPNKFRASETMDGYAILRTKQQDARATATASRRTIKIDGRVVPCANVPPSMASEAGELLCQGADELSYTCIWIEGKRKPPFSATYYDGADGKRHFSLRSPEGGADVGAIAKTMAKKFNNYATNNAALTQFSRFRERTWTGGGHEHAAGFDAPLGWEGE